MTLTIGLLILWALTLTLIIVASRINKSVSYGMQLLCVFSFAYPILIGVSMLYNIGILNIFTYI